MFISLSLSIAFNIIDTCTNIFMCLVKKISNTLNKYNVKKIKE